VLPITTGTGDPEPDPRLNPGTPLPRYLEAALSDLATPARVNVSRPQLRVDNRASRGQFYESK
jgi:hypothetical protein